MAKITTSAGRLAPASGAALARIMGARGREYRGRWRARLLAGAAVAAMAAGLLAGGALPPAGATAAVAAAPQDKILGVSCPAANACAVVGLAVNRDGTSVPLAEAWNGRSWAVQHAPAPVGAQGSELRGVSCLSAQRCEAAGEYFKRINGLYVHFPLAERWNGRRWAIQPTPRTGTLAGVSCTSRRACIAVGATDLGNDADKMMAQRWNGHRWAVHVFPRINENEDLTGVSCTSVSRCIAVGFSFQGDLKGIPVAERWNGLRWRRQQVPSPADGHFWSLYGVSCSAGRACTAVGTASNVDQDYVLPFTMRWNGHRWARQHVPGASLSRFIPLSGVSCPAARTCVAAGFSTDISFSTLAPVTEVWDGTVWSTPPNPAGSGSLAGVSCSSRTACTAVGDIPGRGPGQPLAERWDGTAWTVQAMPGT